MAKVVQANPSIGQFNHTVDHDSIHAFVNRALQYQATISPAAGATVTVDVDAGLNVPIQLPAGNITIGATTNSATPTLGPYPGEQLTFWIKQDSVGGRTVTWDASFINPPGINAAANASTAARFANTGTATTPTWTYVGSYVPSAMPPSGAAGGSLTGAYPAPGIAAGAVGNTQINTTTDPLLESAIQMAVDAVPTQPSKRSSYERTAVAGYRGDPWLASLGTATALPAGQVNLALYHPIWVPTLETFDQAQWYGITAAGVGASFRAGLYSDTGDGLPYQLIWDGGAVAAAVPTIWPISGGSWNAVGGATGTRGQLAAGLYWLVLVLQSTPTTYPSVQWATSYMPTGIGNHTNSVPVIGVYSTGATSGALPATAPNLATTTARHSSVGLRVASRP